MIIYASVYYRLIKCIRMNSLAMILCHDNHIFLDIPLSIWICAQNCWVGISFSLWNARSFNSFFVWIMIELDFPSSPNLVFFQYEYFLSLLFINITNEQLFKIFPIYFHFKESIGINRMRTYL